MHCYMEVTRNWSLVVGKWSRLIWLVSHPKKRHERKNGCHLSVIIFGYKVTIIDFKIDWVSLSLKKLYVLYKQSIRIIEGLSYDFVPCSKKLLGLSPWVILRSSYDCRPLVTQIIRGLPKFLSMADSYFFYLIKYWK
jgi:hypothetical protein